MPDVVHIEDPPPDRRPGPPSIGDLLTTVATGQPPWTWARVKTFDSVGTARVLASQLRHGTRGADRPPGEWEFVVRMVARGPDAGRYGVWARFRPPAV